MKKGNDLTENNLVKMLKEVFGPEVEKILSELDLGKKLVERDAEIVELKKQLATKNAESEDLGRRLATETDRSARLERRNAQLEETRRKLVALYDYVTNSLNNQLVCKDLAIDELLTELGRTAQQTVA